jgi:deazaflavin-dependent oxidoreductase (nitroreductase family)
MSEHEYGSIRYIVDDVAASFDFYTNLLGFTELTSFPPAFADIARGNLRLLLSGPTSSGARALPDGRQPLAGGWNRIHLIVADIDADVTRLRAAGVTFRSEVISGPGGSQVVLDDPSGNPIELFQPAPRVARIAQTALRYAATHERTHAPDHQRFAAPDNRRTNTMPTGLKRVDPTPPSRFERAYAALAVTHGAKIFSRHVNWKLDPLLLRLTRGRVASTLVFPTAVLETSGAKSGAPRRNAIIYFHDGTRVTIIASNAGDPHHPAWYHNLRAHPDVRFGGIPMRATVVTTEDERDRLWALADFVFPAFLRYRRDAAKANRTVPIIQLTPIEPHDTSSTDIDTPRHTTA